MPSHSCFVPGCKSGYPTKVRRARQEGKDIPSLFRPPKHMVQLWNSIIQRNDRNLHSDDVVCSLHFKKEDIEYYYTHVIDGQVVQIERGNPKLRKGAVPSIFSCHNLKGIRAMRRSRALTRHRSSELGTPSVEKKCKVTPCDCDVETSSPVRKRAIRTVHHKNRSTSTQIKEEFLVSEQNCNFEETDNLTLVEGSKSSAPLREVISTSAYSRTELYKLLDGEKTESTDQLTTKIQRTLLHGGESEFSISVAEETQKSTDNRIPKAIHCSPKAKLQVSHFTFHELLEFAYMIPLPSSLWAVHKQPRDKYIAFVHVTFSTGNGFETDRGVVFEGTCKPIIFFYGHKVPLPQLENEVVCVGDVSNLLRELDQFRAVCLLAESAE